MKALQISNDYQYEINDVPIPELTPNSDEVLIKVLASALNRRDVWIQMKLYPNIQTPCILGSDCCGVVVRVANTSKDEKLLGQTVIVNPALDWGSDSLPSPSFHILGMPCDGTFAEYLKLPSSEYLFQKPPHLSELQAAALPLAGSTAWRACMEFGRVKASHRVLVTGVGSGVAQFAVQICAAVGAEVWVTSSETAKIEKAVKVLGAKGGFLYSEKNWTKQIPILFDVVIDGVGGNDMPSVLILLVPGGKFVTYGATGGVPPKLPIQRIFLLHLQILGSTMASPQNFADFVHFVNSKKLVPLIEADTVRPFSEIKQSLSLMKSAKHFGKLVIDHQKTISKL